MGKRKTSFNLKRLNHLIAEWQSEQPRHQSKLLYLHLAIREYLQDHDGEGELDWLKQARRTGKATLKNIKILEAFFSRPANYLLEEIQQPRSTATSQYGYDKHLLAIPTRQWNDTLSPPAALLRAEFGIVPFAGRKDELEQLSKWMDASFPAALALITGTGAIVKSGV